MVALHFDHAILYRAARAALRAQLLTQQGQRDGVQRQALDHGDALAAAALGLARHPHHAIANGRRLRLRLARALRQRLAAGGTHAARFGGIDETALGAAFHDGEIKRKKAEIVPSADAGASGNPAPFLRCAADYAINAR
ncbi:hypothetical protein D3C72_1774950 [compost metagenome]